MPSAPVGVEVAPRTGIVFVRINIDHLFPPFFVAFGFLLFHLGWSRAVAAGLFEPSGCGLVHRLAFNLWGRSRVVVISARARFSVNESIIAGDAAGLFKFARIQGRVVVRFGHFFPPFVAL